MKKINPMKKLILSVLSLLLIMSACSKVDLNQELKWTVGEDAEMVIKEIKPVTKEIKIEIERTSLCINQSVRLIIEEDGESKFEKRIDDFPFSKTIKVSKNSNLKITSKAETNESLALCVRQGNADILLSY